MPFEEPAIKNSPEGKRIFAGEHGPILAKDVADFETITEKIEMGKDIDKMKELLLTEKPRTQENISFAGTMIKELESGNPDKALDFCLSQSKNDSNRDYSDTIKKLYKWIVKSKNGTAVTNEKVAASFIKEASPVDEDTINKHIIKLIQQGNLKEALLATGEHLLFLDKEILRLEKQNDSVNNNSIDHTKQTKKAFTIVRDTLLSQTLVSNKYTF